MAGRPRAALGAAPLALQAKTVVPGHGALSTTAREDLQLTRDDTYLLMEQQGRRALRGRHR